MTLTFKINELIYEPLKIFLFYFYFFKCVHNEYLFEIVFKFIISSLKKYKSTNTYKL